MADIALTAAQIAAVYPQKADIKPYIAVETITAGQAVYFTSAGKVGIADANAAGKQQFRGIALNGGAAGQEIDVLHEGEVSGFTVSSLNADALLYLSDNAGSLADAAGTMSVIVGRVKALSNTLSDGTHTKVVRISTRWDGNWS